MIICPNLSNKEVAQEFDELKSALMAVDPKHGEAMAYLIWSLNNGNAIDKAPNGAESLLFKSLVDYYEGNRSKAIVAKSKTYSTNFLKWFGNWTGEEDALPEFERGEVSKVIDENGEPLLMFHASINNFKKFDKNKIGSGLGIMEDDPIGFYFTDHNIVKTKKYNVVYPVFLNAKTISDDEDFLVDETYVQHNIKGIKSTDVPYHKTDAKLQRNRLLIGNDIYDEIIVFSSDQIKHIENRDGKYTGPNIYHNISSVKDIEPSISEPFSPYPEYDEETKKMFQRLDILQKEFNDLKNKRLELNKKLQEAKCDTISKKIITLGDGRIKFVEKPNHLLYIDNDQRIFTLVSASMLLDGNVVTFPLLFPSRNVINPSYNYYRTDNSIRDNTDRLVYEMLSVLKNHGHSIIYSPWHVVTSGLYSEPDNAGKLIERMSKVLGIKLSDFVTHEETVVEDDQLSGKVRYYRIVFNIDTMLNRLNVLGHNKEIYDIINKAYEQKPVSKNNDLLIKALLSEERDIDERQSQIQKEMRDINEGLYKKEQENSDLPFNVTQGSLIWLVKKYINEGRSKLDLQHILNEINYTNGSKIKINWSNFEVYGELLSGKDNIKRTNDDNEERIKAIVNYLNEKFGNKLQVEYIDEDVWLRDNRLYNGSNSCVIGDIIYLRKSRMTTEIAAEEMLHTLIHGMKHGNNELGNKELFNNLFEKAKQQFPYLWQEILSVYKYNHDEELVTLVLARYFNRDFDKHDTYKLEDLINKFKNWFIKLFKDILEEFAGNYYTTVGNINPLVDFLDISDMLLAKNLKFDILTIPEIHKENLSNKTSHIYSEDQILHNISARQQAAQDEANRLITRMNVLHKQYEKIKSKTPSQERLANQIFETLNRLKQHRDISAVQIALDQAKLTLGQYDPTTSGPVLMSSIYKYLYDAQLNGFSGVSPQALVDMYRNSIKFYKDLIDNIPSEQAIDLTQEDKNSIADLKSLIDDHIMPIWTLAIMLVGDQIVDEQIDSEVFSSDENKEDMKKVAKDWLHKNLMYGDITAVTSYVYNYSNSSNPIIKQAFHLIQAAEQKTLEEVHGIAPKLMRAYQKANSGARSFTPGWQSMMMEFDDKGIPTGNFVRDINYGLYQKDYKEFLEQLNQDFINKYGFTYVIDDTGAITNSLTGEFAEDEEWGSNGEMPKYIEYLQAIERFKANRIHRRYKPQYYIERLSRPYDGTIDPMSAEFKDTKFHHGLSPKTLSRYTYYQSNINYYLNKCQDPNTGLVYPEKLSSDDQLSLDKWKDRLDKFTSIFNEDGSYKVGEDLKMAYEVRAWLKWLGQHNNSEVMLDDFNRERIQIQQESINTNNPRLLNDFLKYNSRVGINPDYIKQSIGDMRSGKMDTDTSFRGKLLRASLQGMVNNPKIFGRELHKMINNPLFWLHCKSSDQAIEDANDPDNTSGWDKDKVEAFQKDFYQKDILYVDEYGFYIDENGNKVNPNDPSVKGLEDAGKLLTFRQYLINRYTDEALRTGQVLGLIDESTGTPIDFSGLTLTQIRSQISSLLSYKKTYWDEDGNIDRIENEPLTIFSILAPTKDKFFNKRTNREEPTVILVGDSRFKDSQSFLDDDYYKRNNKNNQSAEIPDINYNNGRYDNWEAYNNVMKDNDVRELYELLILTMQDMLSIYSTNRKFNYKLPQINARTSALFSRLLKRGYTTKSIQGMWNSMTTVEANDDLLRTKQDYFVGVDGEIANDVPLKFIRDLKNKEDLSTDLVSSVIMFADMALNYKNKSEIDSKLKILRYNMDNDIREVYESKLKPKSEQSAKENDNSLKMFDSMMDVSMYGNKFGQTSEGGPSKTRVALHKTADAFLSLESSAMLGLNMFSMSVGFADSITRIFSESVAGKYMTIGDCLWGLVKVLYYTPACIKNMFNPLANNKMTALMQMNGISKGTFGIYTKADWGKGRKFFSNLLMGGWSMLDWMANALLMMSFYHNCRLYEGDEIPKGFYTKYEMEQAFLKAGKTKADGKKAFHNYSNLGSRITLWDAYDFKNGQAFIKPQYELFVTQRVKTNIATKTKKRGALYNGMNPDNDVPRWKRDVIGRLAGALRGWIIQLVQHLIAGGTDSIARTFTTQDIIETNSSGTRKKTRMVKDKLTDEQRSRRMSWDYETGAPQDQILIGLWRSFKTIFHEANQLLLHKPRTAKLSEVEKYAWKDTLIFLGMLSLMMVGWTFIHDDAREVVKPTTREEAGPASMLNPVDYYTYIRDVYVPNQYWKLAVDDIYFRTVEAKISNVNPQQVLDIVNALTALKSGLDDQLGIIGLTSDIINGENTDEVLKQGAYKFYTKGERSLYRAVGPVKNLHTFLTYYGATNNLRWYTNKFGKVYRAFGYDFKTKDKEKESGNVGFDNFGGNFEGGDFSGGDFSGGDSF